jgi:hypothetical protein
MYVTFYRWTFKNFGLRRAPQSRTLFNASFLLIVTLTTILLAIDLLMHSGIILANSLTDTAILLAMVALLFVNHLVFLNNRLLTRVDERLAIMSRHSRNVLTFVVLIHVIVICGIFLFTLK